ncbi:TIM barrel protein [Rouxiella badensis]|uniref:sugar phosphate isomerase/epimerase family protein n=1 Tax=Rouxiella badensis TaxID=1646377 RepID=UPI001788973D|nr:TIM barrel protein [Rouxiella badensis]MCC3705009.1 TIM barrel protein [Rouxiella badensis]QOI55708.1 TIM barrel protein [Rouxiella badensis subsp. acadiensis]
MKFSSRINSFKSRPELFFDKDKIDTIDLITRMASVKGLTHVELNYPEHFQLNTLGEIKDAIASSPLALGGIALRYQKHFNEGEFSNPDPKIREKAIEITMEAVNVCRELGGNTVTLWFANDGFDYPFQLDYERAYKDTVDAIKQVVSANPDITFSFEYKPYEPRTFSLIGDVCATLMLIDDVGEDNLGITLDFCHMIMKKENPAYSLFLSAQRNRLVGFHLNDGYGHFDDGLMLGTVHLLQTLEYIYYAKKYKFDGLVYFDTFPSREDPVRECEQNIKMYNALADYIDSVSLEEIDAIIKSQDAIKIQSLLLSLITRN